MISAEPLSETMLTELSRINLHWMLMEVDMSSVKKMHLKFTFATSYWSGLVENELIASNSVLSHDDLLYLNELDVCCDWILWRCVFPCLWFQSSGPRLNIKTVFPGMGIPMLKIRLSRECLIFNMGIPMLVKRHLYIETPPQRPILLTGWGLNEITDV